MFWVITAFFVGVVCGACMAWFLTGAFDADLDDTEEISVDTKNEEYIKQLEREVIKRGA